jgi:hypothetical protein
MISFSVKPSTFYYHFNLLLLKEVSARLQQNEDEVSSDEESFVSITEVPYAGPNMAEIYKAHKQIR